MMMEVVAGHGCALGCHLLMRVFCAGSCFSGEALELHPHLHEQARWKCHQMCAVCMAEEEDQKSLRLAVCWRTQVL